MSAGAFKEVEADGRPHWSASKIVETATVVLVTATLSTVLNSGLTRYQIDQAHLRIERQDEAFIRITKEVVELQKQTVALTAQLAAAQKQQDEQQRLLLELIRGKK